MPTIKWLATAAIQGVVATLAANPNVVSRNAILGVTATFVANQNVVSKNAILVAAFVILVVVMVAAPTVRVRMVRVLTAVVDSVREMVLETTKAVGTAKSVVPVAIPIAEDA